MLAQRNRTRKSWTRAGRPRAAAATRVGPLPRRLAAATAVIAALPAALGAGPRTDPPTLPFAPGEELVYRVSSSRFGRIGTGTMRVDGSEHVRGRLAYRLRFDFETRVGPFRIEDHTRSWLDPRAMAALRYRKLERSPIGGRREEVEIYPDERRWASVDGGGGALPTRTPLDELSFLYFIRTLPLADSAVYTWTRHFDAERNPVTVRVAGRERLELAIGTVETVVVEMRVRDADRFGGEGVLRLYLTDDAARYPVRIVTSMPVAGTLTLDLAALSPGVAP